jgi:hypothetical protein
LISLVKGDYTSDDRRGHEDLFAALVMGYEIGAIRRRRL